MLNRSSVLLAALLMPALIQAQDIVPAERSRNIAERDRQHQADLKKHAKNEDMMVRPGLLADRRTRQIKLLAESTAIGGNDPVEFILISTTSGHDYEAMAVSLAKPSDIHNALLFIGMEPGTPVNYQELRMWPKGERVLATFEWDYPSEQPEKGKRKHFRVRAESLILDRQISGPMKGQGFAFVGSSWSQAPDNPTKKVYAADVTGPNSIISLYNDPETVMDVPSQSFKESVYSRHVPNSRYQFDKRQLVTVTIEPEHKDGKKRIMDLHLLIGVDENEDGATVANLAFVLKEQKGKVLKRTGALADVLTAFEGIAADNRDPHVTIQFTDGVSLDAAAKVCSILQATDVDHGIHIAPPPEGHPYYKAFMPEEKIRERRNRIIQPWELRVSAQEDGVACVLTRINTVWVKDKQTQVINDYQIDSPESLKKKISVKKKETGQLAGPGGVFVFTSRELNYGTIRPFLAAVVEAGLTVFVYLE